MHFNSASIKISSLALLFALLSGVMVGVSIKAAVTDSVTATVTAQNISVTVADGTVAYGTMVVSTTADTTSGDLNDSQTATNDGNITEDFNIMGQDTAAWTLAGTIGSEQYRHRWCTTDCDGTPTWSALTTSYQTLASTIATSGTSVFDLEMATPSSTATYTQQSADVTVQAVQP